MSQCKPDLLSAYLDDELSPADHAYVMEHLRTCPDCARELQLLQEALEAIHEHEFEDLTPAELARAHAAVDRAASEQSVWRIGVLIGAIAASILIIGGAWLSELPVSSTRTLRNSPIAAVPAWERMAVTLNPQPLVPVDDQAHFANAELTNWMLQGLSGK